MRKNLRTFYNQDVVSEKLKVADDCIFEVIGRRTEQSDRKCGGMDESSGGTG